MCYIVLAREALGMDSLPTLPSAQHRLPSSLAFARTCSDNLPVMTSHLSLCSLSAHSASSSVKSEQIAIISFTCRH